MLPEWPPSCQDDRTADLVRQIVQASNEGANLTTFDLITAEQVDGYVQHNEAGVIVVSGFLDLAIERSEHRLAGPVEHDKFVILSAA